MKYLHEMCVLSLAATAWAAPIYKVTAIGPSGASATGINNSGVVVGNYQLSDGSYRVYVWNNGVVSTLGGPDGASNTKAFGINDAGQISGYADIGGGSQALLWSNLPSPTILGAGYGVGINSSGEVAGMRIRDDGSGAAHVFRPTGDTALGQPAGGSWSSAYAISDSGTVAGTGMTATGGMQGFVRSSSGNVSLLGTLGGRNSYARSINSQGTVAGGAQTTSGALAAVIWQGTAPTALGSLGGTNSYASDINQSGSVVGYADLAGSAGTSAFLYQNGNLYDLNTRVLNLGAWRLLEAVSINDSGWIVGRGMYGGEERAYLLTPIAAAAASAPAEVPEPKTLLLMGAALISLALLRNTPKHE